VRQAAAAGAPAAQRRAPPDGARPRAPVRHDRRRGHSTRELAPPPCPTAGWQRWLRWGQAESRPQAGLNTRIQDAGWRQFLTLLAYKAAGAGKRVEARGSAWKRVEAVTPASTSPDGSGGGERIQKSLSGRPPVWTNSCLDELLSGRTPVWTNCGRMLDRDEHAAKKIVWLGQRLRGVPAMAGAMIRDPVGLEPARSVSFGQTHH
jgi:hypothetical protein